MMRLSATLRRFRWLVFASWLVALVPAVSLLLTGSNQLTGGGFEVAEGVDAGWTLDFVDGSTADRSPNGAVFAYPGATWRRMKVALTLRPESQLAAVKTANVGPMWVVLAKIGRGSEVVVAPRSMDAGGWYYLGVLHGQLTEWSPLAFLPGSLASMESATFEEIPIEPLS